MKPGLRQRLARGETLIGIFSIFDCPDLVETLGHAGWDFAIVDCEHGPFGNEAVGNLIRACQVSGLHSVVRVPNNDAWLINKALDVGAEAVLIPQIDSVHAARRAVSAVKYAPRGQRGANPFTRANRFAADGSAGYYERANRETLVMLLVEGASGAADFEEMVQIEDADAFFIGPVDLSHSLGLPGQTDHPRVMAKIAEMVTVAREHGKAIGTFGNHDMQQARKWMQAGVQFMAFGVDSTMITRAFQDLALELRS